MITETMAPLERILAAVRFEQTDRTPVVVGTSSPFLGKYKGITPAASYRNLDLIVKAEEEFFEELGGWDLHYNAVGANDISMPYPSSPFHWAVPRAMPGEELPDHADVQTREDPIFKEEDYDRIIEIGWPSFWVELIRRVKKDFDPEDVAA